MNYTNITKDIISNIYLGGSINITTYGKVVVMHICIRSIKKTGTAISLLIASDVPIPVATTVWRDLSLPQEDGIQFTVRSNQLLIDLIDNSYLNRVNDINTFMVYIAK